MPAVDTLRCFLKAAQLRNFRAAAKAVSLSPAALGQRIRMLEEEFDSKLFHRTTRSIVLTEAGLNLLPYAERALAAIDDCVRAAHGDLGGAPLELVLGTRHELGLSWLVPMISKLEGHHPGLTIHLYFGSGPDLLLRVRSLAIDCAVTSTRLTDPKIDSIRLHEERYVFVGQTKLLERLPLKSAKDTKAHTLFDTTEELSLFRYWRDAPGGVDSLEFGKVVCMGIIAAIRARVIQGAGVAVLPEYFVAKELKSGRLTRLLTKVSPLSDHFRLIFRSDDPRRTYFETLAENMLENPLR